MSQDRAAPPVVGTHEIAEMLGITRARVNQLARERGFPLPYAQLKAGNVWKRVTIEAWAKANGRTITDDAER